MRFIEDGPDIPDELLLARDAGDVILFCGAGVSQAEAGLPNFAGLWRKVIQILGAAQDSRARALLERALTLEPMPGVGGLVATGCSGYSSRSSMSPTSARLWRKLFGPPQTLSLMLIACCSILRPHAASLVW